MELVDFHEIVHHVWSEVVPSATFADLDAEKILYIIHARCSLSDVQVLPALRRASEWGLTTARLAAVALNIRYVTLPWKVLRCLRGMAPGDEICNQCGGFRRVVRA